MIGQDAEERLEPWQVIANDIQVYRKPNTQHFPFVDQIEGIQSFARSIENALKGYGYLPVIDGALIKEASRRIAVLHYAERFGKAVDDRHVQMNADANWEIFSNEAKAALSVLMAGSKP